MIISKSLFKEYINMPQLARWSKNNKDIYKLINQVRYAGIDWATVGQAVEDAVLRSLADKHIASVVTTKRARWDNRYTNYDAETRQVLAKNPDADVIYQPGFLYNNMYCKCDLLVKNDSGTYDLREVKAKNTIRKKTKAAPLLDDLIADVSFQDQVLRGALGMMYSGNTYIIHLNKKYKKNWDIDLDQLLIREDVSDELMTKDDIDNKIISIQSDIPLTKPELDTKHPYIRQDHLSYFGTMPAKGSIWKLPRLGAKITSLYQSGKTMISDLDTVDRDNLRNAKWEETGVMRYLDLWNQWETVIKSEEIKNRLDSLQYPLYFYDYETISVPIPVFEQTHSWQQVITQYSMHRMDADGTITHTEWLIDSGQTENKSLIDQLVSDFGSGEGSYIVWYKWFENSRNTETGEIYPQHQEIFNKVNEHTFDLMDIFKEQLYFDRRFGGSCSIKKVLPVLTDISYSGLVVPNWAIAADLLAQLAHGTLPADQVDTVRADLLQYCKQDTRAMVRIWEVVCKAIG